LRFRDGFIKKTQKTPPTDLELARENKALHVGELKDDSKGAAGYITDRVSMISWKRRDGLPETNVSSSPAVCNQHLVEDYG
jgi:hypothetical protein